MHVATFVVTGTPIPKRLRTAPKTLRRYRPKAVAAYMKRVAAAAFHAARWEERDGCLGRRRENPWPTARDCAKERGRGRKKKPKCDCAWCSSSVRMDVTMFFPDLRVRDRDNVLKGIQDACKGVLYRDDTQVDDGELSKRLDRANPRVEIVVRLIPPAQMELGEEPAPEPEASVPVLKLRALVIQLKGWHDPGADDAIEQLERLTDEALRKLDAGSRKANP